jgi:hypothetical protein
MALSPIKNPFIARRSKLGHNSEIAQKYGMLQCAEKGWDRAWPGVVLAPELTDSGLTG